MMSHVYFNYATNLDMKFNGGHKLSNILMIRLGFNLAFHQGNHKERKEIKMKIIELLIVF